VSSDRRRRVLILRALGLGDLLTSIPALRALRRGFPDHQLVLALPSPLHELAMATGAVDEVLHAEQLGPLPEALPAPELAVNLHGRGPQSHNLLRATRPKTMFAFRNEEAGFVDGPDWRTDEHERVRWCRMLEAFAISADPGDMYLQTTRPERWEEVEGATVIHPGAASAARRWPVERFAAVARSEIDAGRKVVVTGAPGERDLALQLCELAGLLPAACLAGETTVTQLAAIVQSSGRVLCGDTGVAHLAAALRTPSVILFGPTSPDLWGPPLGPHVALWTGQTGDPHAGRPDLGLLGIEVASVVEALLELPQPARSTV
jgi:ADP-heptose:LPS heptosyltransferase